MKTFSAVGAALALATGAVVGVSLIGAGASVGTAPGRMVSDTMRTQNIKQSYEYFHDASNNFEASVAQVTQYKAFVQSETDAAERSRLRIEMAAIQQGCRNLAAEYNSNSAKVNHGIFRGTSTPSALNSSRCE
jgi:hypothetical protein